MAASFSPSLFTFLRALKRHNTREWFADNRARFAAEVEAPMMAFITDIAPHLKRISPAVTASAKRVGGSIYRIHRDTRFSPDKTPYKTHVAMHFTHEKKRTLPSVPGFYLHLEPGDSMGGGGIYHPDMPTLTKIRHAIADGGREWTALERSGVTVQGEALQRAPAGFPISHPRIAALRQKDFYALATYTEADVCAPDFLARYVEECERIAPLMAFLCHALGIRW